MTLAEIIDTVMNWVVAPLTIAMVWLLGRLRALNAGDTALRQEMHDELSGVKADVRVVEARLEEQAQAAKESRTAVTKQLDAVITKLNDIETYLRRT